MGAAHFLKELVVVLGTAAVTGVLFQKLRQPVVLGYLLAGLLIGPHVPTGVVADERLVRVLSELGIILLMFSIGLEFSIRRIAKVGAGAALTSAIEVAFVLCLGFLAAQLLGWTSREGLFIGAGLAVSSTMLVVKSFEERGGPRDASVGLVYAILVFEDMIAIFLLALLAGLTTGTTSLWAIAGKLGGLLTLMLVGGLLVVPRAIRFIARMGRPETLLIASMAICFAMSLVAEEAGTSVALGAFLAGMLVSESGEGGKVEPLILPFRDVFSAVFFVAVGMSIDPAALWAHALPIVLLTAVVVGGKLAGVTVGAFLAGNGLTTSVRAGLSLGQIGELSFILAGLGVATGAARGFVLPVLVGVSCLTALVAPLTARAAGPLATIIDARLPRRVQTFVTFYGTWIEGIRAGRGRDTLWARVRRPVATLIVDTALLGATVVATALHGDRAAALLGLGGLGRPLVLVAAALLSGLFLVGALRCARRLGITLAAEVLPPSAAGKVDLGTAPRRALVLTLELAVVLVVGLPLVAFTLPFVPGAVLALGLLVGVIGFSVWRSITNLQGHVRAGSELIVETLARQSHAHTAPGLHEVKELLPGIPGLEPIRLPDDSPAVGRSLAQLNVRALTGATVLAIQRRDGGSVLPSASEVLQPGDVLALAGPKEAIEAAGKLLTG